MNFIALTKHLHVMEDCVAPDAITLLILANLALVHMKIQNNFAQSFANQ